MPQDGVTNVKSGKTSGDATGYKRGAKGYAKGGQWDHAAGPSIGVSFDKSKLYGPVRGGGNVGDFPGGKIKDTFKGSRGVDASKR